jgi:hypothetical protein
MKRRESSNDDDFDKGPGIIFLGFLAFIFWCVIAVLFIS